MDRKEDKNTNKFCNVENKNHRTNHIIDDINLQKEKPKKGHRHKTKHERIDKEDTIQKQTLKLENVVPRRNIKTDEEMELTKQVLLKRYLTGRKVTWSDESCSTGGKERMRKRKHKSIAHTILKRDDYHERKLSKSSKVVELPITYKGELVEEMPGNLAFEDTKRQCIETKEHYEKQNERKHMSQRKYRTLQQAKSLESRSQQVEECLAYRETNHKSKRHGSREVSGSPARNHHKSKKKYKYIDKEDSKIVFHRDTAVNNVQILYVSPNSRSARENHTIVNEIQSSKQEQQFEDKLLKKLEERIGIRKRDNHTTMCKSMTDIKEFEKHNSCRVCHKEKRHRQKKNSSIDRQTCNENGFMNKSEKHNYENCSLEIASVDTYNVKEKTNSYNAGNNHLLLKDVRNNSQYGYQSAEYSNRHKWNLDKGHYETPEHDEVLNKGNTQFFEVPQKIEQYMQRFISPLNECSSCYPEKNNFINLFTNKKYCGIKNVHVKPTNNPLRQEVSFSSLNIMPNENLYNTESQFSPTMSLLPEKELNVLKILSPPSMKKFKNSESLLKERNNETVTSEVITKSEKQFYEQYNRGIEKLKKSDAGRLMSPVNAENVLERILKTSSETGTLSFTVAGIEPPIILNPTKHRSRNTKTVLSNKVLEIALLPVVSINPTTESHKKEKMRNMHSVVYGTCSNNEGNFIIPSPTVNNFYKAGNIESSSSSNVFEILPTQLENITEESYSECSSVGKAIYVESKVQPQERYSYSRSKNTILEEIINKSISKELQQTKLISVNRENVEDSRVDEVKQYQIDLQHLKTWEEHIVQNIIEGLKEWKLHSNNQNGIDSKEIFTERDGNGIALNDKCSSYHIISIKKENLLEDNNKVPACKSDKNSCGLIKKLSQKSIAVQTMVLATTKKANKTKSVEIRRIGCKSNKASQIITKNNNKCEPQKIQNISEADFTLCTKDQQAVLHKPFNLTKLCKRARSCSLPKNKKSITSTRMKINHETSSAPPCKSCIDIPHDSVEVKKMGVSKVSINSKRAANVNPSTCLFTKTFANSGRPSSFEKRKNYDAFRRLQKDCKQFDLNYIGDENIKLDSGDATLVDAKLPNDKQKPISNFSRSMKKVTPSKTLQNKEQNTQKSTVNSKLQPFTKSEVLKNNTSKPFVQKQNEEKNVCTTILTPPVETPVMVDEYKEVDNSQDSETSTKKGNEQTSTLTLVEPKVYEDFNHDSVGKNKFETCTTQDEITEPQSLNESFNNTSNTSCNNNARGDNVITNGEDQTLVTTGPLLIERADKRHKNIFQKLKILKPAFSNIFTKNKCPKLEPTNSGKLKCNTESVVREKLNVEKVKLFNENNGSQTSITLNKCQQEVNMKQNFVIYNSTIKLNADPLQFNAEHMHPQCRQSIHSIESTTNSLKNCDNLETSSSLKADSGVSSYESKSSKSARRLLSFLKLPLKSTSKNEKHLSKKVKQNLGKEALKDPTNILENSPYINHFFSTTNTIQNVFPTTNKCFILEERRGHKANSNEKQIDSSDSEITLNGEPSGVKKSKENSTVDKCISKNCPYKSSKKHDSFELDVYENSAQEQAYKKHCHCNKPTCVKCDKKLQQLEEFNKMSATALKSNQNWKSPHHVKRRHFNADEEEFTVNESLVDEKTINQEFGKATVSPTVLGPEREEQSKVIYNTQGVSNSSKLRDKFGMKQKKSTKEGKLISQQETMIKASSEELKKSIQNRKERHCKCYKDSKDGSILNKVSAKSPKEDASSVPLSRPTEDQAPKAIFNKLLATREKEDDIVSRLTEDEEFFQSQLQLAGSSFSVLQNSNEINKSTSTKQQVSLNSATTAKIQQSRHVSTSKSSDKKSTSAVIAADSDKPNAKRNILKGEMTSHLFKRKSSVQEILAPRSESLKSEDQISTSEKSSSKANKNSSDAFTKGLSNISKRDEEDMSTKVKFSTGVAPSPKQANIIESTEIFTNSSPIQNMDMKEKMNFAKVLHRETSTNANTVHPADIGKCFLRGFRADHIVLGGGQCLKISEQECEERAKRLLLRKPCLENIHDNASRLSMKESCINFSERDTALEFLLALGFSIDEASTAIKDEDVKNRLNAAITEARVWNNKINKSQGTLLYLIAYKAKTETMRYFLLLVEAIINFRITNAVKLDGFLKALEKVEETDVTALNILGADQFEDEENEEKAVKKQLRELFITIYQVAKEEAAKTGNQLPRDSVMLLRTLAAKYRAGLQPHLELIARYIGQNLIVDEVQLEAAMVYLSSLDTADVHLKEFEMYCGITCPVPEKK